MSLTYSKICLIFYIEKMKIIFKKDEKMRYENQILVLQNKIYLDVLFLCKMWKFNILAFWKL